MNQAKWRQFENFNFENNVVWKDFVAQLDKSVPPERVQKLKRSWYKDNIDPDFDIDFVGNTSSQPTQQPYQPKQQVSNSYSDLPLIKKALYDAENLLKLMFIIGALLHLPMTGIMGFVVSLLALYRQLKRPRWNKEYGRVLFVNEFSHNVIYLCGFFFVHNFRILYDIPLIVHFWIGIAEYLNQRQGILYSKLKKYVDATRAKKEDLMNMKLRMEVFILPIAIILVIAQQDSLFLILFYGNFLRIKYIVNVKTQEQCRYLNQRYVNPLASKPGIGFIIQKLQQFCAYMVKVK